MKPSTPAAMKLLLYGARTLARVEANGVRIDTAYLDRTIKEKTAAVADNEADLKREDIWRAWWHRYGSKANFDSREQLATILFEDLGLKSYKGTATRKYSADEENLERLDLPWCNRYLEAQKIKNVIARMEGLLREVEGELLHPFFHLHKVETWRSSSSCPNFQNIPIRLDEQASLIRPAFIARRGRRLVEVDFKGAEVRVGYCYHRDPRMYSYLLDPTTDMHRDMAAECFFMKPGQVPKEVRQDVKGMFVFAAFYGSFYDSIAESLWYNIWRHKLKTKEGVGLYEHLAGKGIEAPGDFDAPRANRRFVPQPGTFLHHIKGVYDNFWGERFQTYDRWRRDLYAQYQRDGWFQTLSGFTVHGVYPRNYIINVPIQGSSFHCLLWCLITLQREIDRRGMKTLIVGQIHDSILADVPDEEMEEWLALVRVVVTEWLPAAWGWLAIPMEVEAAASPVDGNWYQKEEVKLAA